MSPGTILITGAASGIGAATARHLAHAGSQLVLVDVNGAQLADNAAELGKAVVQSSVLDVGDERSWAPFWQALDKAEIALDGLVACAGITGGGPLANGDFAAWRRVLTINLDGMFLTLAGGLPRLREGGAAVLVSSVTGIKASPYTAAYGASKAGVLQMARVAALEMAPRDIRVNALLPGGVETPMWRDGPAFDQLLAEHGSEEAVYRALAADTPLGRFARPEEIAGQIAFLLGPASAPMTGAALTVDGGYSL